MSRMCHPPRERAARALCRLHGVLENIQFEGRPMWELYLPDVDAVLGAALPAELFAHVAGDEEADAVEGGARLAKMH